MTYPVNTALITHPANRSGRKRTETRHLVLHETVSQASARRQLAYFNGGSRGASVHGFIDWDEILVTLPLDEIGWHVGPRANAFTEGHELCRARNADEFSRQWAMATWWFAQRCIAYGRDADFIRTHHEISRQYGGTDHTDPDDYFAMYGKTPDQFRADVQRIIDAIKTKEDDSMTDEQRQLLADLAPLRPQPMPDWFAPVADKLVKLGAQWSGTKTPAVYEAIAILDRAGILDDALKARGKAVA